jgi:hypothetical protein
MKMHGTTWFIVGASSLANAVDQLAFDSPTYRYREQAHSYRGLGDYSPVAMPREG